MEICRATFDLGVVDGRNAEPTRITPDGKLDTCGSVSLSHSSHLQQVKDCRKYGLREVVLSGIGGKSKPLREAGLLHVDAGKGNLKKILCYKFDEHVGNTSRILLLSLRTIRDASIDILHHMDKSLEGISSPLLFLQDRKPRRSTKKGLYSRALASKKFLMIQKRKLHRGNSCAVFLASCTPAAKEYAEGRFIEDDEGQLHCLCEMDEDDKWMVPSHSLSQGIIQENRTTSLQDCYISPFAYEEHEAHMSEIQLRRIVDKMATEASEQGTDGDDLMVKDGKTFSKFSKDALEIREDVGAFILGKVRKMLLLYLDSSLSLLYLCSSFPLPYRSTNLLIKPLND